MTQQQVLLSWLKDAHAMEIGAIPTLKDHAAAAEDYPAVQAKLNEHVEVTQRHAELVAGCIERLGAHPSAIKEAVGGVMGKVTGLANLPAKDTVIKNALGDYAAENFEIICYRSLIAAAEQLGDQDTVAVCREILQDEEGMVVWLDAYIAPLTQTFMTMQTGEDDKGLKDVSDKVKETVAEFGERGKEAAANIGTRNALLAGGALLAGAGAAMLIGQALKSGSEDENAALPKQYVNNPPEIDNDEPVRDVAVESVGVEGLGNQPVEMSSDPVAVELDDAKLLNHHDESARMAQLLVAEVIDEPATVTEITGDAATTTEVWLAPGPYTGMGPKAYDSAGDPLGQEAALRLTQHGQVDASNIEITVDNGTVLLEGTVASEEVKRLAEEAIRTLEGVHDVQSSLRVPA